MTSWIQTSHYWYRRLAVPIRSSLAARFMYLQRERSECGGRILSDIDVASMRTVRADGERRRPFFRAFASWRVAIVSNLH